jgi:RecA-family ATPase
MNKWLVHGVVPQNHLVLVAGPPGNGKTWWMNALAIDAAEGTTHLGKFKVEQCSVIYIDEDSPTDVFNTRLERLSVLIGKPLQNLAIDRRSMT